MNHLAGGNGYRRNPSDGTVGEITGPLHLP